MILNKKYVTTISFSFHQAKSNIWHMSVLQTNKNLSEGNKSENKNRHCKSLPESIYDHCYMYSHFILQYVHAFSTLNWARTKLWRLVRNWILESCQPHRVSLGSQFISCSLVCSCLGLFVVHECSAALSCIVKFRYHTWRACLCHGAWNTK